MTVSTAYSDEVFSLVLAAGFYHPVPESRAAVRTLLDRWLARLGALPDASVVSALISKTQGTVVEPFVVTDDDLECAVFLTQAAFSSSSNETRFRIVSRETIGCGGGLVITNNLKCYYAERYVHGKNRGEPRSGWAFFPSLVPECEDAPAIFAASIASEDEGFRIKVPMWESRGYPAQIARELQCHSRIEGIKGSFDSLGLRVECNDGFVHVLSGSPESMIRMLACMTQGATLTLKGEDKDSMIPKVLVKLSLPEEKPVTIPSLISSTPHYNSWFTGKIPTPLRLRKSDKFLTSLFLRPHAKWLHSIFTDFL